MNSQESLRQEAIASLQRHAYAGLGCYLRFRIRDVASGPDVDTGGYGLGGLGRSAEREVVDSKTFPFTDCERNPFLQYVANSFEDLNRLLGTVSVCALDISVSSAFILTELHVIMFRGRPLSLRFLPLYCSLCSSCPSPPWPPVLPSRSCVVLRRDPWSRW